MIIKNTANLSSSEVEAITGYLETHYHSDYFDNKTIYCASYDYDKAAYELEFSRDGKDMREYTPQNVTREIFNRVLQINEEKHPSKPVTA